ncbi:MAG: lysophospholipase [Yoonia sp.]|jgi:lysophospholipase
MQAAPFHADLANGPDGGVAHWLTTSDGLRIRVAHWDMANAKGTVLIFPGRTEYIEKYGPTAESLQAHGYASLAIDWRGQGIADHTQSNDALGHVQEFADYQHDVAAVLAYAAEVGLPRPFFMIAHSMGGCIGLRALEEGLDINAVVFSAPMWGVAASPFVRVYAWAITSISVALGFGNKIFPGQSEQSYVVRDEFDGNTLTGDPDTYAWLRRNLVQQPDLGLGGPSLRWLNKMLHETRQLSKLPSPDLPCLTFLGTQEAIVDTGRIHSRMANWKNGTLRIIKDGRHEMLTDRPEMRTPIFKEIAAFFDAHRGDAG